MSVPLTDKSLNLMAYHNNSIVLLNLCFVLIGGWEGVVPEMGLRTLVFL